jgi:PTH1 family peptidyl-tRNA hydrolase
MLLFVGLGNPGREYAGNRHNIGFMAIEAIAREHRFAPFRARFKGRVAEGQIAGERVILLQPETYMNDSGRSVSEAARFYKMSLPDIVVFHDELDLAPGKLRVKVCGWASATPATRRWCIPTC